ncbi:MAG TPA: hypothetical protein VFD17_01545 [Clostridia bacterium]|nr:hypothetical protein [Clostridia bacterium]
MKIDEDRMRVLDQINNLKLCNNKIRENLSAIQLLMASNDFGRVKDHSVSNELESLIEQVDSLSGSIDSIEEKLT